MLRFWKRGVRKSPMWRGFSGVPRISANLRALAIAILLAGLPFSARAQTRSGSGFGFRSGFHNGGRFQGNRNGQFGRNATFWGDPYFYADYPVQSLAYEAPASPVVIVQPGSAMPPPPEHSPEAVLIEWQGGQYVRSTGQQLTSAQDYSEAPSASAPHSPPGPTMPGALSPTVLVYRDGRREQVNDYVIAGGNIYAQGNYYRDGYWSKQIQLAALDISATLKANEQNGVRFLLPSSPNEVITRP